MSSIRPNFFKTCLKICIKNKFKKNGLGSGIIYLFYIFILSVLTFCIILISDNGKPFIISRNLKTCTI